MSRAPARSPGPIARLTAVGFAAGATVHAISFLLIGAGIYLYGRDYPPWRHLAMTTVDGAIAWIGLRRPAWLLIALPLWIAEQFIVNGVGCEPIFVSVVLLAVAWERIRRTMPGSS